MSRDVVLTTLVLIVCGALAWAPGLLPSRGADEGASAAERERATWSRLWAPLVPAAAALALLLGWAVQEPSTTDELLVPAAGFVALPLALVWLRAAIRAWRAARAGDGELPAAAIGLVRPRVIVDERLRRTLSEAALAAAHAHEEAHVRHRDPLRIWLAQIATDLQWPFTGATARLDGWLDALERARDDEARHAGARGEDLADALVNAARLVTPRGRRAAARLGSPAHALASRVERLLRPLEADVTPRRARTFALLVLATLVAAALFGFADGDLALRALPFVTK